MLEFFQSVLGFFETLFQLVVNFISGFVNMLNIVPKALSFVYTQVGFMPTILLSFVMAAVTVRVIYLILGRNS